MKSSKTLLRKVVISAAAVVGSIFLLTGCEQEGPAERAGRVIDDSAERAEESMDRARDEASHLRDSTDRQFIEDSDDQTLD